MSDFVSPPEIRTVPLSSIIFDEKIYPRTQHDPAKVQQYERDLEQIEARQNFMSVSSNMKLLDGRHRHLAYLNTSEGKDREVQVYVYPVTEEREEFALAVELNSTHGQQLTNDDKRSNVLRLYGFGYTLDEIARLASVRKQTASDWTRRLREDEDRRRDQKTFEMYLACATHEEIAAAQNVTKMTISRKMQEIVSPQFLGTKSYKLAAFSLDTNENGEEQPDEYGWRRPLYNVWRFDQRITNEVTHFGNSEQRILENLLYLYTEPFDIVVDPFAGGGSSIDVCKRRLRRYWVSDRKPSVVREREIRRLDVVAELPPLGNRWSEVTLTCLDPPYWRQAEGQYSDDPEDLANMPLDAFTDKLIGVVNGIAAKQSRGVIALLIQPTQWKSDERRFTDHVLDLVHGVNSKRLILENRVSCPYQSQQYNAQQVEWAKANRKLLVLTRELIIWRVAP